jgi:hypothetical protein
MALLGAQEPAHAEDPADCEPTATVEGGGPARAQVVRELRSRGIATMRVEGCAFVSAQIEASGSGLAVVIVDAYGRTSERSVNGPVTAATLIESWVRTDVSAALLSTTAVAPAAPVPAERRLAPRPSVPEEVQPTLTMPAANPRPGSQVSLTAGAETSVATDGSLWLGITAGLCFRVGPVCAGALVRVSDDSRTFGESREMRTSRLDTDVLLGASLPIRKGRITLLPGLGVGIGWMRTTASNAAAGSAAEGFDIDGGGLRASAGLQLSIAVTRSVAVDLAMSGDVSPVAHTGMFDEGGYMLAGEPRGFVRGGVGVRVGLP